MSRQRPSLLSSCLSSDDTLWLAFKFLARRRPSWVRAVFWVGLICPAVAVPEPIRLHPDNPHYFLFRGKPTVLVTSGEHYGAVLNLDFDYVRYLEALKSNGLNLTRLWPGGPYLEIPGSFNIANNTLAPKPNRFSCIWQHSSTPGYLGGGNKFDLTRWDEVHLSRLKDFVAQAGKRGIVVELSLFCPYYNDKLWDFSPLKFTNNVNNVGDLPRTEALTLKNGGLLKFQEAMVRKLVAELRDFDNIYYEICNEPYFGGVTLEWQHHIADVIREQESGFPKKHLIAQNIANGSTKVENPHPAISIFNFHYSRPPDSVALNYGLNKVIGLNETGFDGPSNAAYRIQGWDFVLAGGALYNNLDYSFTVDGPGGTFEPDSKTPGGGSPALRRQLQILKDFIHSFDFVKMMPDASLIQGGVPAGAVGIPTPHNDTMFWLMKSLEGDFLTEFLEVAVFSRQLPPTLFSSQRNAVDQPQFFLRQNRFSNSIPTEVETGILCCTVQIRYWRFWRRLDSQHPQKHFLYHVLSGSKIKPIATGVCDKRRAMPLIQRDHFVSRESIRLW